MLFVYDRKKVSIIAHLLLTIFIITFSMINCISCSNARNNLAFAEIIELSVSTEFIENSVEVLTNVTDETIVSTTTTEETVISNIIQTESTEDFSVMSFENNNDPKNIVNIYIYITVHGESFTVNI